MVGCEAAIHAMWQVFTQLNTEAVLLVDATNLFNCLNCKVALQNILCICPSVAPALVNCYHSNAQLFVGGEVILHCSTGQQTQMTMLVRMSVHKVSGEKMATCIFLRKDVQPQCTKLPQLLHGFCVQTT